jgi:uncharacterized protein YjbJ (UPF0337 family)
VKARLRSITGEPLEQTNPRRWIVMDKDRVKGAVNDAAGRAKRQVGEWTGDTNAQVEGSMQQVKGKAQKVVGNIKDAARDVKSEADRKSETNRAVENDREHEHAVHQK